MVYLEIYLKFWKIIYLIGLEWEGIKSDESESWCLPGLCIMSAAISSIY